MTTAVAITLFNGEKFLYKQLESIRLQTTPPDQVVLCDDGSIDDTITIVNEYIEQHKLQEKWTLVENDGNLGYARNFYKAMSLCNADLIFLADQDDIWKDDKIEKMCCVMVEHPEVALLSCKFEIMDVNDKIMHGLLAPPHKETFALSRITTTDLLRGFYWPGMLMCIRSSFFEQLLPHIGDLPIAHDRVLSHCAADKGLFYEYDYIGAYHRRHDNNTAEEEHRVSKLLNLQRKLHDVVVAEKMYQDMLNAGLPLGRESIELIKLRLCLLQKREEALKEKSIAKILKLYCKDDSGKMLRKVSLICDIWLICFGHPKEK